MRSAFQRRPAAPCVLCALALLLGCLAGPGAAAAQSYGITVAGSTTYPTQGLRRVGEVVLNNDFSQGLYGGAIDVAKQYAYFGGRKGTFSKINLTGFFEENTITLTAGGNFSDIIIDDANGYAYAVSANTVYKVLMGGPGVGPVQESTLSLGTAIGAIVLDATDPNPANHYAYIASYSNTAEIFKLQLPASPANGGPADATNPTLISTLTLNGPTYPGPGSLILHGAIDTSAGFAYFEASRCPNVIQIALNGAGAPTEGALITTTLPSDTTMARIPAIDTSQAAHYLYLSSYFYETPSTAVKINLSTLTQVSATNFQVNANACNGPNATEMYVSGGLADAASRYLIWATDGVFPMKVFKMKMNSLDGPMTENTGWFHLLSGTVALTDPPNPTPPCDSDAGLPNGSPDNGATFPYGEVFAQGLAIDQTRGYAYIGQDSSPGQVTKIGYSQLSAVKATEITVTAAGTAAAINFYSMAAAGNLRLGIYDNGSPQNLLWDSGVQPNAAAGGWISIPMAAGTPASLTLTPGIYWLAWQVDNTLDVPSYTAGAAGTGLLLEQAWGPFPGTMAGAQVTSENWSIYVDAGPAGTGTPSSTATGSPSASAIPTGTASATASPTASPSFSATPSALGTSTATPTSTVTGTQTLSATVSPCPTASPTTSVSATAGPSPSVTPTASASGTSSPSPTVTASPSVSATATVSATASPTGSPGSAAPDPTPRPGAPVPGQVYSYPNPAVPGRTLTAVFEPCAGAEISVYDWAGHRLLDLPQAQVQASLGLATWNALDASGQPLPSGLYFLVLRTGPQTLVHKFSVLRP